MSSRWQSPRTCQQCGQPFKSSRRDAKYCSPKCRKQVNLTKKKIDDLGRQVLASIHVLDDYCEQETFSEQAAEILGQIRRSLDFTDKRSGSFPAAARPAAGTPVFDIDVPSLGGGAAITVLPAAGTATKLEDGNFLQQLSVKHLESRIDDLLKRVEELEDQVDWRPAHER